MWDFHHPTNTTNEVNLSGSILILSRNKRRREEQNSLELTNDIDRYLSDLVKNLVIILMCWHGGKQMSLNTEFYKKKLPKMFWSFQCRR